MLQDQAQRRGQARARTCLVVPAAHHVVDHLFPVERVLVSHGAEGGESPVDGVHAQVCGEMIREFIFALADISGARTGGWGVLTFPSDCM